MATPNDTKQSKTDPQASDTSILKTASILKPVNFDVFLDEVGFSRQSPEARAKLIDRIYQSLDYVLSTEILQQLEMDDKFKLMDLMEQASTSGDEGPVNDFLLEKIPNVEQIVEEAVTEIKNSLRVSTLGMSNMMDEHLALVAEQMKDEDPEIAAALGEEPKDEPEATEKTPDTEEVEPANNAVNTKFIDEPFPWEAKTDMDPVNDTVKPAIANTADASATPQQVIAPDTVKPTEPAIQDATESPFPWEDQAIQPVSNRVGLTTDVPEEQVQQPVTPDNSPAAFPWEIDTAVQQAAETPNQPESTTAENVPNTATGSAIDDELRALGQ